MLGLLTVAFFPGAAARIVASIVATVGAVFFIQGLLMIYSSRVGKLRARDRLLDGLRLRGDERVLDVGCGRGLLLIGAAKRLPGGTAAGLDIWSQEDLSANSGAATMANARAEGVAGRVELHDGDMRAMPFDDAEFDAVVACFSIHNIYDRDGRRQAIREIVRVLKPGGQVALLDFEHTKEYAEDLRAAGLRGVRVSGLSFTTFPMARTVTGVKPAGEAGGSASA